MGRKWCCKDRHVCPAAPLNNQAAPLAPACYRALAADPSDLDILLSLGVSHTNELEQVGTEDGVGSRLRWGACNTLLLAAPTPAFAAMATVSAGAGVHLLSGMPPLSWVHTAHGLPQSEALGYLRQWVTRNPKHAAAAAQVAPIEDSSQAAHYVVSSRRVCCSTVTGSRL